MSTIPSVFDLKGQARTIQKQHSCPLHVAYQKLAHQYGYRDWSALNNASKQNGHASHSINQPKTEKQIFELPSEVTEWIADFRKNHKPSEIDVEAFKNGLIFGYDFKEGNDFQFDDIFLEVDQNELSSLTASDLAPVLWNSLIQEYVSEYDCQKNPLLALKKAKELDPIEFIQDALNDMIFIRFTGENLPINFENAYALAIDRCFWHPLYMWFQGKFFNLQDIPEISVRGVVVSKRV